MKWRSQLEIALMSKIVAAPKVDPAKLQEQEADMRDKLAEAIASKLLAFVKSAGIYGEGEDIVTASWGGALMTRALEKIRCSKWRDEQASASSKGTANGARQDGGKTLVPKVIEYDKHNKPQEEVETIVVEPRTMKAEPIPWVQWQGAVVTAGFQDEVMGRTMPGPTI